VISARDRLGLREDAGYTNRCASMTRLMNLAGVRLDLHFQGSFRLSHSKGSGSQTIQVGSRRVAYFMFP